MPDKDVIIEVNANFHHVSGENILERKDERFKEYRRKWKQWPESFHVGGFPLFIDVEVTSVCNLRCPFCATTYRGDKIARGFMPFDTLKKIVDEGADNDLYGIKLNIRGEPLLHPKIDSLVAYAKDKGLVDVYFNTNAMLMTEEVAKKLIDAGLDRISVSFEGFTKEVYERNRVGARFETVLANIEALQSLKARLGVDYPRVRVQTVLLPELVADFEQYKEFWSARVEEVGMLDFKEMKAKKTGLTYPWACPQIWQRMGIWWDGTIFPCNHDDDGGLALGNINEISIKQAWTSPQLSELRQTHREGLGHQVKVCDGCYLRDSEILKRMEMEKTE
ncbi:MAG: radical SAM protein [bacterium]|nr:radical SAM protein [bacterium]